MMKFEGKDVMYTVLIVVALLTSFIYGGLTRDTGEPETIEDVERQALGSLSGVTVVGSAYMYDYGRLAVVYNGTDLNDTLTFLKIKDVQPGRMVQLYYTTADGYILVFEK